jgi:Domain of unknown function (DUF4397)
VVGGLASVPFLGSSAYLELPAASYDLKIASPDGNTDFIDPKPVRLNAGAIVTLVAQGGGNSLPLDVSAISAGQSGFNPLPKFEIGPVNVRVAHLAPFAATADGSAVSVKVNGAGLLSNFRYQQLSDQVTLPKQGVYRVEVIPQGATTAVFDGTVDLDGNRTYALAAIGDIRNQAISVLPVQTSSTAPATGQYKLQIVHAAPFANTSAGTNVSIRSDGGAVIAGLNPVPFKASSGFLELPVGALDVKVASPDGSTNLIDLAPVSLPAGSITTVFAVGNGREQPLAIYAVPGGALLPLEKAVDFSVNGAWWDSRYAAQGVYLNAVPRDNRLTGSWYAYDNTGAQKWYHMDSCGGDVGASGCVNPGAFNNQTTTLSVYETSGGRLGVASPTATLRRVGELRLTFQSCIAATADYTLSGGVTGSLVLSNITPLPGCTIP